MSAAAKGFFSASMRVGVGVASGCRSSVFALCALFLLTACAVPRQQDPSPGQQPPRLVPDAVLTADGYRLPLRRWGNPPRARALILAVHGFNDYGHAFAGLGSYLAGRGMLVYAYDQRGFGSTARRGIWAGEGRMIADLGTVVGLLRARHPGLPLFLIGESMGGAVVMAAAPGLRGVEGVVLIAPAVWSRKTMHPLQRSLLSATARTLPGLRLTGRGLGIRPTDNYPAWRAFSADPLVIKASRVDALWGLTNLMDRAAEAATEPGPPRLVLYGERDQIIPPRAFCSMLSTLPDDAPETRIALYRRGWHMLTRDLQGAWVMADIAAWIEDRDAPLPSGEEVRRDGPRVQRLCGGG